MSNVLDQFLLLVEAIIKQVKKDLISEDDHLAIQAAKYFFLTPARGDVDDLTKFAGLCNATEIDADTAAKAIFKELLPCQQKRIRRLLRDAGYRT